VSSSFIWT